VLQRVKSELFFKVFKRAKFEGAVPAFMILIERYLEASKRSHAVFFLSASVQGRLEKTVAANERK